ncbi:type II secretion system protein N [Marimonas arenosa]|uniref:Type II secretion system protein GspC N-terminal domain-containing protein n=1 Tax=Marimonas arenosa TaxID=1795305 RepID=A0AAE3WFQ1_9RHOB|nr:type II secretion system protein N [Marimonas arenosa]MDQ2090850.1 hypothetical protein [Marimonas arenosa]
MTGAPRGLALLFVAVLATAGAGVGLYRELSRTPLENQALPGPDGEPEVQGLSDILKYDPPPLAAFNAVLEKPLFSPTRQPPETVEDDSTPPAEDRSVTSPQRLRAKLLGVVVSESRHLAILEVPSEPTVVYVSKGEELLGWTLKELGPDTVEFERNGETVTLTLEYVP